MDAELIAAHVLDTERGRIFTYENFSSAQANSFRSYVDTRCSHVPVQYIIGLAPFRYLEVEVGPGVLIPRPETELVAQHAIDTAKSMPGTPIVVDLGSGSGAIALSIATEAPRSRVIAVERESSAFVWLKRNVANLAPSIECKQGDVADALQDLNGQVDIAVANPPYVNSHSEMPFEVSNFEPAEALFGGRCGNRNPRPLCQSSIATSETRWHIYLRTWRRPRASHCSPLIARLRRSHTAYRFQ